MPALENTEPGQIEGHFDHLQIAAMGLAGNQHETFVSQFPGRKIVRRQCLGGNAKIGSSIFQLIGRGGVVSDKTLVIGAFAKGCPGK